MDQIAKDAGSNRTWANLSNLQCRLLLAGLLAFGFFFHLVYLSINCPLDLTADEAHYWDWSRDLDLAYYSKGPLVAYVNWTSTNLLGPIVRPVIDNPMVVLRLPALILGVGTSLCFFWLTKILFDSERLALGVVAIVHTIPMFMVGGMLMTIDPPYMFCWALATCFAAKAIFHDRPWFWIAAGVAIGFGLLAKYAAPLWFLNVVIFAMLVPVHRKLLLNVKLWLGVVIGLLFFVPPLVWNINNDWVTFKHVGRQIGVSGTEGVWYANIPLMLGTQAGVLGGVFAGFIVAGLLAAIRAYRTGAQGFDRLMFLVCFGLPFFLMCVYRATKVEIEPNWPAPTYVTMVVLAVWWIGRQMQTAAGWQKIRGFFIAHLVIAFLAGVFVHRSDLLYPVVGALGGEPAKLDRQIIKMRGNQQIGDAVSNVFKTLPPGSFILTRSYQDASLLGFYVKGQPKPMHAGSFLKGRERTRQSQFDLWKDRDLTDPIWHGRDAVILGPLDQGGVIQKAFTTIERVTEVEIRRWGYLLRSRTIYIGRGFKGLSRPEAGTTF